MQKQPVIALDRSATRAEARQLVDAATALLAHRFDSDWDRTQDAITEEHFALRP